MQADATAPALCRDLQLATDHHLAHAFELSPGLSRRASVSIRFDLKGRAAGQARFTPAGGIEIRYNLAIAALQPEQFLRETVPHEVAHVVTWLLHGQRVRPHGPEWRAVMRHLGVHDPQRCHEYEMPSLRSQRRWPYRCACKTHQLSTTRHRRAQQGTRYQCKACGTTLQELEA